MLFAGHVEASRTTPSRATTAAPTSVTGRTRLLFVAPEYMGRLPGSSCDVHLRSDAFEMSRGLVLFDRVYLMLFSFTCTSVRFRPLGLHFFLSYSVIILFSCLPPPIRTFPCCVITSLRPVFFPPRLFTASSNFLKQTEKLTRNKRRLALGAAGQGITVKLRLGNVGRYEARVTATLN